MRTLFRHRIHRSRKRLVRVGLFSANLAVLGAVVFFILNTPTLRQSLGGGTLFGNDTQVAAGPLDQLSSADIAVNVARIARLPEAASVVNHADSVNAQLTSAQTEEQVVAKPLVASAPLPSKRDIRTYTVKPGDTLASIANSNGVSSESVKWSNTLVTNNVTVGNTLYLPPSGVNGIVYVVKAGDTPDSLAQKYNANKDLVTAFNDAEVSGLKVGERILIPNGTIIAPRPVYSAAYSSVGVYGFNGYDFGWCTWYAASRRAEMGRPVPANLGHASRWVGNAINQNLPVGTTPAVGAVAQTSASGWGHVAVVEVVNADGSFWISEMNSSGQRGINDPTPTGGWNVRDFKFYSSAGNIKFIY